MKRSIRLFALLTIALPVLTACTAGKDDRARSSSIEQVELNSASKGVPGESWLSGFLIFVYGTADVEYMRAVGGDVVVWSSSDPEYVASLHANDMRVDSQLLTMQGYGEDPDVLRDAACADVFGNPARCLWIQPNPPYLMCHNNPAWQQILKERACEQIEAGVDAIHIDEIEGIGGHLYLYGLCDYCTDGFRRYLRERFTAVELLERFGIADVDSFDYREYLLIHGAPSVVFDPNPELRAEFVRFQMLSRKEQIGELIRYARECAKRQGRSIRFSGNTFFFSANKQPLAQLLDFVVFENTMYLPHLNGKYIGLYLLAKRFFRRRPVVMFPDIVINFLFSRSPDDWRLFAHWLMEATSVGASFLLPYHAYAFGGNEYHLEAERIAPYTMFLKQHANRFWNAELVANIAVLYDYRGALHDYLYQGFAVPFYGGGDTHDAFLGTCLAMQEAHIPFDVIYVGDGELVRMPLDLGDLLEYAAVVVPPSSDPAPELDGLFERYAARGGTVTRLDDAAAKYWRQPNRKEYRTRIVERILSSDIPQPLYTDADDQVGLVLGKTEDSLVLHIVNYDYDFSLHDFVPSDGFDVCVEVPEELDIGSRRLWLFSTGNEPEQIEFDLNGTQACFHIPPIHIYSLAAFD